MATTTSRSATADPAAAAEDSVVSYVLSALSDAGAGAGAHAAALAALCDVLAMASDSFFDRFPIESFASGLPAFVASGDGEGGVALLAARAIAEVCEGEPRWAARFAKHGAVAALRDRLLAIEYIDLAEECLRALYVIAMECPGECLRAGVAAAALQYFDFFSTSKQKVALRIVENACYEFEVEHAAEAMEAVPVLCGLLQCADKTILGTAVSCLAMIASGARGNAKHMDRLCECQAVEASMRLMKNGGWKNLSEETLTDLLGLLEDLASVSVNVVRTLFESGVCALLREMISFYNSSHSAKVSILQGLIYQLIRPVATSDHHNGLVIAKKNDIVEETKYFNQLVVGIVPLVIQVAKSGALSSVCYSCVLIISNIVELSTPNLLMELQKTVNVSSFLVGLLARKDRHIKFQTLKIAEILLRKDHQFFFEYLNKEGVKHAIDAILSQEQDQNFSNQQSTRENNKQTSCHCSVLGSSPSSTEACRIGNDSILKLAEQIKKSYFGTTERSTFWDRVLEGKRDFFARANGHATKSPAHCEQLSDLIRRVSHELPNTSPFEFMESGLIIYLADHLSNGTYLNGNIKSHHDLPGKLKEVQDRLQRFTHLALTASNESSVKPLRILAQKLLDALHMWHYDKFPVILSDEQRTREGVTKPVRHSDIHQPKLLNLKIVRSRKGKELLNYDQVLPVDLCSTPDAIEAELSAQISTKNGSRPVSKASNQLKGATPSMGNPSRKSVGLKNGNEHKSPSFVFFYNGEKLRPSLTFYESIVHSMNEGESDLLMSSSFWDKEHKVTYRRRKRTKKRSAQSVDASQLSHIHEKFEQSWQKDSFFHSILLGKLPDSLDESDPSYHILFVLKVLEGLNRFSYQMLTHEKIHAFAEGRVREFGDLGRTTTPISQAEFVSSVLTHKLEMQMQDSLFECGAVPSWCVGLMEACPFLFAFDTRWKYFCLTMHSSLTPGQDPGGKNVTSSGTKKYRVIRSAILEAAASLMTMHAQNTDIIEVKFSGEVGTGRGPTVEFYTMVSRELQRVGHGLWRGDTRGKPEGEARFVCAPFGLFPQPWPAAEASSSRGISFSDVVSKFKLLGQLVARAILDGRILDIPLSKAFYKVMLEQELDIYDIPSFDPEMGKTLIEFQALVNRKKFLEASPGKISDSAADLSYRNATFEEMCLDFTLPGMSGYNLISGGSEKTVTLANLEEYVSSVVHATVNSGISRQIEAFKSGINEVFALNTLKIFTEEELERILCGEQDAWAHDNLANHIEFGQGYDVNNPSVICFLEILQEFGREEQRAFLQFTTGAPQLPLGGLASLDPKLTVVRKQCDGEVDEELPSVNTCRHFIKLPPYSSKEIMRQKLKYAFTEGLGSFHLS